jgi:hypothetical protein
MIFQNKHTTKIVLFSACITQIGDAETIKFGYQIVTKSGF